MLLHPRVHRRPAVGQQTNEGRTRRWHHPLRPWDPLEEFLGHGYPIHLHLAGPTDRTFVSWREGNLPAGTVEGLGGRTKASKAVRDLVPRAREGHSLGSGEAVRPIDSGTKAAVVGKGNPVGEGNFAWEQRRGSWVPMRGYTATAVAAAAAASAEGEGAAELEHTIGVAAGAVDLVGNFEGQGKEAEIEDAVAEDEAEVGTALGCKGRPSVAEAGVDRKGTRADGQIYHGVRESLISHVLDADMVT